jgi:hypothetical protein
MKTKNIIYAVIGFIVAFALMRQCEGEPKVVTNTVTKIVTKHDTITNTIIKEVPKTVYVEKVKTVKGKDSIIYKDKPNDSTITANQYDTELKSNEATAKLKITTTGELLDVSGIITYPEKETTTTIIKTRDASGLYLFGSAPIKSQALTPEIGLQYNIKNKMFISTSVQYNNLNNNVDFKIGVGIKIF